MSWLENVYPALEETIGNAWPHKDRKPEMNGEWNTYVLLNL